MASGETGILPSTSHSQAAAKLPIIQARGRELVLYITRVEYANKASPDPTGIPYILRKAIK